MTNPYSHSSGGSTAPGGAPANSPLSPEDQLRADYELAIGPNRDYYLPKFEAFDAGGSKVSWHWPAFFVTSPWYMYRKMWLPGLLNLAYPFLLLFVLGIAFAAIRPSIAVMVGVALLLLALPSILLPMFANAIYWRHIRGVIQNLPSSIAQVPEKRMARLERSGGTGAGPMIGVLAGMAFFFIFIVGMLAAIAIPAYQDYTIRAQVTEGLNLATLPKAVVAEYFSQNKGWPETSEVAGIKVLSGKYVESVSVERGSVVIVYGGAANQKIRGKTLILLPGRSERGDVVWACAGVKPDGVVEFAQGRYGTDLTLKYLPMKCREGAPLEAPKP